MNSDKKIWDDFRKGENYALSHIYYQHVQLLFRYGMKFTKNSELVKDSIQDLFFDLIRTKNNLGETDNIQFYLMRSFRRKLRRNLQKQSLTIENLEDIPPDIEITYSVEHEFINKEELTQKEKMVQIGLSKLTAKQREILFYKFTCDFDYDQICEIMSLKYDSSRKLVFRSLQALKEVLPYSLMLYLLFYMQSK